MKGDQAVSPQRNGPLSGVRIIDLTKVIMGPFATQILADQGADVITVEGPGVQSHRVMGDYMHDQLSGISMNLLRNKKSVCLDLMDLDDRESFRQLIKGADVLVTTLRPGSLRRLGLDYDACRELNESLLYCHAQGHPVGSGSEDEPAYDDVIQASAGVGDVTARAWGDSVLLPTIMADKVAGMAIAQAVSAGLYELSVTGQGQRIEVPMTQAFASFMLVEHGSGAIYAGEDRPTHLTSGYKRLLTPERRPHKTKDGIVHLFPYSPEHYRVLFEEFGSSLDIRPDLFTDKRAVLRHSEDLYKYVRVIAKQQTTGQWIDYCRTHGIPVTRVRSIDDLVGDLEIEHHPVVGDYRVIRPMANFSRHEFTVRHPAPLKGEHTDEIIKQYAKS